MNGFLSNLRREFDWHLKQWLRWSAPVVKQPLGTWGEFEDGLSAPERQRLEVLSARYDLERWPQIATQAELYLCLQRLDWLDQHLGALDPSGPCLDIGALNWAYLPALATSSPGHWLGVELDAHQRYVSFDTRAAQAQRMATHFNADYRVCSVLDVTGSFGLITWFLPFVTPYPLKAAGLPDRFFEPERLLGHAVSLLAPNAQLFIVNKDAREAEHQAQLLRTLDVKARSLGALSSPFEDEGDAFVGFIVEQT